jgi:starch phosphorylase
MYERFMHDYFATDQLRLLAGPHELNMTQLALNLSGYVNGVAVKHAETTTRMFPGYDIRAVTNGVHLPTWVHPAFAALFNEHSRSWAYEPEVMVRFDRLPDARVWAAHEAAKADLVALVAERCGVALDPALPTIGFARRMTAYKRPALLFSDLERLKRIAGQFPFQLVLGGKAHPADHGGKQLIAEIHGHLAALAPHVRAVFVPNYDFGIARTIVAGVDVWLNTPEPPLEASGTSGMKAALNGVLNLSVLDGWWLEGCIESVTGWGLSKSGPESANELYDKLEGTVLPLYHRSRECWLWMMKQTLGKIPCFFNTHRMMRRYATEAYIARRATLRTGVHGRRSPD